MRYEIVGTAVKTTITADLSPTGTSFSIADSTGWPTGTTNPFVVTMNRLGPGAEEKILCNNRTLTTINVTTRGFDTTTGLSWPAGTTVECTISAALLDEANAHVNDTSRDDHSQYLNNARHDQTARHTAGTVVPTGTPGAATPGDVATEGSSASLARLDHKHGMLPFATPISSAPGDLASAGSANSYARSDHKHAREPYTQIADNVIPAGSVIPFAGTASPTGWMICDGSAISRTTFSALFAAVGTTYGVGDGSSTFNIPNLKGRVVVGRDSGQTEFQNVAQTGGEKNHQLVTGELPSHAHNVDPPATVSDTQGTHQHSPAVGGAFVTNVAGGGVYSGGIGGTNSGLTDLQGAHSHTTNIAPFNSATTGSDTAHNNLQPYMAMNHIIKVA